MRKSLGIIFACVLLCGLGAVIIATPRPQSPPEKIEISINCNFATDGVDTPFFIISKSLESTTTISWTNNCALSNEPAEITFKGDTPLIDGTNRVHNFRINKGQTVTYSVKVPDKPTPTWSPDKIYKFYKYDVKVENGFFDPGGGVRP